MSRTHFAVAAAAFSGASDHAAGKGVSSSGAGAIKWCCCQCISATGAYIQQCKTTHANGASELNVIVSFNSLSFYHTWLLRSIYSRISQTYRFTAHLQTTKFITYWVPSHKGLCLNLLAICSAQHPASKPELEADGSESLWPSKGIQRSSKESKVPNKRERKSVRVYVEIAKTKLLNASIMLSGTSLTLPRFLH